LRTLNNSLTQSGKPE